MLVFVSDYITKCDFDSDESPFCDWSQEGLIRSQAGHEKFYLSRDIMRPVSRLKTEVFYLSGASCLEFWYYKPGYDSSELRVLLSNDYVLTQIWSSLHTEGHTWKQVLIPLSYSEIHVKIIFEVTQRQGMEETVFDRIGIQRGQCDSQCHPDTQLWTDEFTQCTCIESQLTCTKIACGDGQPCSKAVQSKRSSDSFASGTCKVKSDLRYTTFDGVKSRFMGHCIYLLTEVCDEAGLLPYFVVEVKYEQIGKSSKVQIQQVNLNIQHLRVTLPRREKRKIMVNGIWRNLPLSLSEDTIKISAYGPDVVLQTNFNLSVSFAKTGALELSVPIQYSNKLCGMCGNFNNLMDDDKNMPDRSLVKDTQILGQKWKSASFYCQDPIVPSMCSESEKLEYADKMYCGVLLSQNGPFAKCSSSLDTSSLFRSCISEMCITKGDHEAFCNVLQAVEKSCSEVGISVTGWRNATHCSLACGSNSHFNACSSDCPATCSGLDAAEDCGRCQERCDCDDGLLLSGGRCVPIEDCGCWVDGQHYEKGERFMDDNCESLCMCAGQGNIQCSAISCLAHEVCKVENGVIGCFPSSPVTCSVYGDPHYITFDGKAYSFQGTCNYTIATACDGGAVQFTLTARNEELRNYTSSSLNSVALDVNGFHLAIRKNKLVYVNGSQITLPFSHSTSVSVSQTGPYVKVETNFGLRFLFNGNDRLFVQVDERHKGRMCGLCGTYSGSQFDDFLTPGGSVVPYSHDFANSWNTHDKDWPCINGSENKPKCSPELENKGFQECSKLFGDAFKACHWFVPPQIFVNSCMHDFCTSGGDQTQLCTSLENYVAACEVSEVFLGDWRKGTVCDVPTTLPTVKPSTPTPSQPTTIISIASCLWSCNFDQDECGWEQLIQDSLDWTRLSGSTPSDFTGPSSDHTTGSGFYMYIEGDGVYHGDSARMLSPECNTLGTQCMTFWYHMYGGEFMILSVYLLEENRATKIWTTANNQGNQWHLAQIEINPLGPFRILFEGRRGHSDKSDVALDDVSIRRGPCGGLLKDPIGSSVPELSPIISTVSSTSTPPDPPTNNTIVGPVHRNDPAPVKSKLSTVCKMNCNFDYNLCTWTQLLTDVFDWTRQQGSTPTSLTGPSSDHTTGTGYYLYIEGDSAAHGDTARLLSEECYDVQPQCLQFWYHMYGSSWTMGLSVYLLHGNVAQEVWRKREDQGNTWHQALVDITPHGTFRILFEGRRGDNARSDVALDDIFIHRGTCAELINHQTVSPAPGKPTLIPTVTSPTTKSAFSHTNVCAFGCNFDNNLCTWSQLATDVFDWTRHSGPTSTALTGPSSDHTTGTGYYLYIEGDNAAHGDTARLLSEECSDVQPQCLQFWYHMYGSSWTMGLSVYLLHGNVAQEVWRKRENQGNVWHQALVDITPHGKFRVGYELEEKERFWSELDEVMESIPMGERVVIGADFNGHVGEGNTGDEEVMGKFGVKERNLEGQMVVDFAKRMDMAVDNTYFQKREEHRVTYKSGGRRTQVDYILCRRCNLKEISDCKVVVGESAVRQHRIVVCRMTLMVCKKKRSKIVIEKKTKWWKLKKEECCEEFRQKLRQALGGQVVLPDDWETTAEVIRETGRKVLGVSFGRRKEDKETWWWNEEVQDSIQRKRLAKKKWDMDRTEENRQEYKESQCRVKREVSKAKQKAYDELYTRLDTREGEKDLYRLARQRDRDGKDVQQVRVIKDRDGRVVTSEESVQRRWKEYFEELMNEENEREKRVQGVNSVEQKVDKIRKDEVRKALKRMSGKAVGPDDIPVEILFEGRRGHSERSDVALDDVSLQRGPCAAGYYLYIEGDSATHGDTARLLSEECYDVQRQCLQFWYHMYGSSWTMGLSVYLLHGNVAQEVWRKREDQGNVWHQALVDITPHGKFRILFEGRRGHSARSDVALDDVFIHRGPCADLINHQTVSPAPGTPTIIPIVTSPTTKSAFSPVCTFGCNFDNNLCTWSQLATDVFDWTRHSGPTSTALTGPSSDHTTGTGYYLYIEGDSATHGDTARLLSEECSDVQPQCLQFWYHMYGSSWTMGLSVYLLHGNVAQEVWRKRENQGNVWHQALVDITPHGTFRILFEGRRGDNARSDVALDDVFIHTGPCADLINNQTISPAPGKPTLIPTVTSPTTKSAFSPVCAFDCNFDNNLCTWSQLATDVFDWTRHSGPTSTALTGPLSDHTTGTGYYLYIEGDSAAHGDTARLLSEECSDVQPQCLQFWYHMYGSSWTMGLSIYLLHGNEAQEVWRKREDQGNVWHQALVDITPHGKFRILFEGRRGHNARSDVAVDDVFFHRGTCAGLMKLLAGSPTPDITQR
ncbi:hypothetical protein QTP86_016752 [Hemibagrus guttatus]|nr:hypothetical protein QTP86_016752 [Hemibagrus guttatus]